MTSPMTTPQRPAPLVPARPCHAGSATARFTLLELLVTIGIIGILCALFFAAIGAARAKGQATTCINNLRECYIANMAYNHDYDGFLPPNEYVYGPMGECTLRSWDQMLIVETKFIANPEICYCPSWEPLEYAPGRVYGSFVRAPDSTLKTDNIPGELDASPTNIMFLLDSIRVSDLQQVWFFAHQGFGCWQRIHIRHQKRANVALLDGHVEPLGRGDVIGGKYKPIPECKWGHWYVWPQED